MSKNNEQTQMTEWQKAFAQAQAAASQDIAKPLAESRIKQVGVVAGLVGLGAALHAAIA